jgi:WD40 repeat protein
MSSIDRSIPPNPEFILQNTSQLNCVLFSAKQSDLLYASNRNGDLNIYNLELRRSIFQSNPNKESILSIAELENLELITQSRNGSIYKWIKNNSEWKYERIYHNDSYTFCQFELNQDKTILYVPSNQPSVIDCIDMTSNKKINSLMPSNLDDNKKGMLMNMKSFESNLLLAGYESGELSLFDLRNLKEISSINLFNGQPLMCFDFSKKANFGFSGSTDLNIKQFSIENDCNLKLHNSLSLVNPGLNTIKIRELDSKIFATGGWDSRIRLYGLKKQKLLLVLDFHKEAISTIDFSIKNGMMAAGSNDNVISFWSLFN